MSNVQTLKTYHHKMTPRQAIEDSLRFSDNLSHVIVVGLTKEGDLSYFLRNSEMDGKTGTWIAEVLRSHLLRIETHEHPVDHTTPFDIENADA